MYWPLLPSKQVNSGKCHATFNISFYFVYIVSFVKYIPLPESMKGEISSNRLINLDQNPIGKYGISYNRMMISEFSQWGSSITGLWSDKLQKVETVRNLAWCPEPGVLSLVAWGWCSEHRALSFSLLQTQANNYSKQIALLYNILLSQALPHQEFGGYSTEMHFQMK